MSVAASSKPPLLVTMQAWLRARPVLRATIWAILSCALLLLADLARGTAITFARVAITIAAFAIGGVVFYLLMRWWEANHAR